jgi:hypothetical protein
VHDTYTKQKDPFTVVEDLNVSKSISNKSVPDFIHERRDPFTVQKGSTNYILDPNQEITKDPNKERAPNKKQK